MQPLLHQITQDYRSFVDDQVLTSGQLNEFLAYFEDQHRLSRICLTGVGIVCGFDFKLNTAKKELTLNPGCGITTDGDLLRLLQEVSEKKMIDEEEVTLKYTTAIKQPITYTHYRNFTDEFANYTAFQTEDSKTIPLFKLASKDDLQPGDKSLSTLDLTNKIAVLYLESYPQTPDICTETNCDNLGERQVQQLHVLLIDEEHIDLLLAKDSIYRTHHILEVYKKLPEIKMPRVILNTAAPEVKKQLEVNLSDLFDVGNFRKDLNILNTQKSFSTTLLKAGLTSSKIKPALSFSTGIKDILSTDKLLNTPMLSTTSLVVNTKSYSALASTYQKHIKNTIPQLANAFDTIITQFAQLLRVESLDFNIESLRYTLEDLTMVSTDIQYTYDFVKELTQLYTELRDVLLEIQSLCCPPVEAFPKHLILGKLSTTTKSPRYRHSFYKATLGESGNIPFKKAQFLLKKVFILLKSFRIPEEVSPVITPSNLVQNSSKAIPFYFEPSEDLVFYWDFNATQNYRETFQLSYYKKFLFKTGPIQDPLAYDLSAYNFLRIEGIHGLEYTTAIKELDSLKKEYGLAFDVKAINIDQQLEDIDLDAYSCHFDYLETNLKTWRAEQNCINKEITEFFSGFNIDDLGSHNYAFEQFGRDDLLDKEVLINPDIIKKPSDNLFSNNQLAILGKLNIDSDAFAKLNKDKRAPLENLLKDAQEKIASGAEIEEVIMGYSEPFKVLGSEMQVLKTENTSAKANIYYDAKYSIAEEFSTNEDPFATAKMYTAATPLKTASSLTLNTGIKAYEPIVAKTKVNDTVTTNLKTDNKDLGFLITSILDKGFIGSAGEIEKAVDLQRKTLFPKIDPEQQNLLKVGFEIPNGILARLQIVASYIPESLATVTDDTKAKYSTAMQDLCAYVKKSRAVINEIFYNPQATYEHIGYETLYAFMLDRIEENCCAAEQLEIILTEIESKKTEILDELIFENFVRKHPGLEHHAGVIPGGTFVLVYSGALKTESDSSIPANTVVADFALPYQCCSDCAPIGFIIPDAITSSGLILDASQVCVNTAAEDAVTIGFTKSPADGVLDLVNKNITGISFTEEAISINPAALNAFDTPIQFTVNGQLTTANLTAIRKPIFEIKTNPATLSGLPGSTINIQLDVDNKNSFNTQRFEYLWSINETEFKKERPIYEVKIPQEIDSEKFEIPVKLTLSGTLCDTTTVSKPITVTVEKPETIKVYLEETTFCEGDKEPYNFIIKPEGAEVEIEGKGVSGSGNSWIFVPAEVEDEQTEVIINKTDKITITIVSRPKALSFSQKLDTQSKVMRLTIDQDFEVKKYVWLNDGKPLAETDKPFLELSQTQEKQSYELSVTAETAYCGTIESNTVSIEIPAIEITDNPQPEPKPDTNACVERNLTRLTETHTKLEKLINETSNDSFRNAGKQVLELYKKLIDSPEILEQPLDKSLAEQLIAMLDQFQKATRSQKPEMRDVLFRLYCYIQDLSYAILYCQDDSTLKNDFVYGLLDAIEADFNPDNEAVFPMLEGITFDNEWYTKLNTLIEHFTLERIMTHFENLRKWTS